MVIITRSIATRPLDGCHTTTQVPFTGLLQTQGRRGVVLQAGLLYGLLMMMMIHGAGAPCFHAGDRSLSVCGDGWFNLLHTQYVYMHSLIRLKP